VFDGDDPEANGHPAGQSEGLPDVPEWAELDRLKFEKEALDFYVSSHPLAQFDEQLGRFRSHTAAEVLRLDHGSPVTVGGMVGELTLKTTKQGKRFAILRVEDFTGTTKCVLWSEKFALYKDDLGEDKILLFEGRAEWREGAGEPDVIVERVMTLDQAKREMTKAVVLRIPYGEDADHLRKLDGVAAVLRRSRGPCPVYLTVRDPAGRAAQFKLADDYRVDPTALRADELEMLLGPGAVLFTGR
jgi:DNA polymerase-3 subunit alpha